MRAYNTGRQTKVLALVISAALLCGCGTERKETQIMLTDTEQTEAAASEPKAITVEYITGSWYGWWRMFSTSGEYAKLYGYWWDACAEISRNADGTYTALLWDEDLPKDNCIGEMALIRENNNIGCIGGFFFDRDLTGNECSLSLTEDACGSKLTIGGTYKSVIKGGFSYEIILRPWGAAWSENEDLPYYYESWYLPLIRDGEPMPDEINKQTGAGK